MRKLKKTLFLLTLAIGFAAAMPAGEIKLTARVIPISGGEDGFFSHAHAMILAGERLFLLENLRHRVLLYRLRDGRAEFLKSIGRRGKGPGDLNLPIEMSAAEGVLSVHDENGVSRFTLDGEFIGRFRVPLRATAMERAVGTYFFLSTVPGDKFLIHAFSENGEKVGSMLPKYLAIEPQKNKDITEEMLERYFYEGRLFAVPDRLFYLNAMLARLSVLDRSGRLLRTVSLEPQLGKKARENVRKNNEMLRHGLEVKRQPWGGSSIPWRSICHGACLFKGGLFLLEHPRDGNAETSQGAAASRIRRIDLNSLRADAVYRLDAAAGTAPIQSFLVGEEGGKLFFLACQEVDGDSGIVRYAIGPAAK